MTGAGNERERRRVVCGWRTLGARCVDEETPLWIDPFPGSGAFDGRLEVWSR